MAALSPAEKRRIAGRARTLHERLGADDPDREHHRRGASNSAVERETERSVDELVEEWRDAVADGDADRFRRRLDLLPVDVDERLDRLTANDWPADEPLPGWVDRLDDLIASLRARDVHPGRTDDAASEMGDEVPFAHVVRPVVEYARGRVADAPTDLVAPSAVSDLERALTFRIAWLCAHTLFVEFKTHVAEDDPDLVFADDPPIPEGSTEYYDEFVADLLDDGLKSLFLEYSFLARLVVTSIDQWVERVEEFYRRLRHDRDSLADAFRGDDELGTVVGVRSFGDTHQEGREVLGVQFESGVEVAYKPRSVGIVVGFYELVEWINERSDLPRLRTLDYVSRPEYAWFEWVESRECDSPGDVAAYYRRAGMFICLFYALDAIDMHLENIVAAGEHPVPIDLETLAEPDPKAEMRNINETVKVVGDTVLRSGVIPRHYPYSQFDAVGGFSAKEAAATAEVREYVDVNTDRMEMEVEQVAETEGENLPRCDGAVHEPDEYAEEIQRGFEEMYRFVLDRKEAVLAPDGPVEAVADRPAGIRVVYRPTSQYSYVRHAMRSPSYQRTGLDFGIKTEGLAKRLLGSELDAEVMALYDVERTVLRNYNTPRFTAEVDATDLYDRGEVVVEDFFERPPIEKLRERIRGFSESDLGEQLDYVRWGYGDYRSSHAATATDADPPTLDRSDFERDAKTEARRVFDRVVASSRTEDGYPTWVCREVEPNSGVHVHPVEHRLYDGRVGIGVFAAALARTLDEREYAEFARETVAPTVEALERDEFEYSAARPEDRPVGGAIGLGSVVYGLTRVGTLLDDDQYLDAATRASERLTTDRIESDRHLDVVNGSAGTILGQLALYDATGDCGALDRAVVAGEHLLDSRTEVGEVQVWTPTGVETPLCGFSHGVAGIAYALDRLAGATGDDRFEAAARDALEYEERRYDERRRNWPDLRGDAERWMDAWCHGRTGVGLARLGMRDAASRPSIRADVDRALDGVDETTVTANDHVCCGNFGRVEFLLEASRRLDDPHHEERAERLASTRLARARADGQFSAQWQTDHWHNPSFFLGEAGVGYSLLRFVDPSLPSVLLWE